MPGTLLLFDIDGTLIRASEAGQTAYIKTIRTLYHVTVDLGAVQISGKTDLANLRALVEAYDLDPRLAKDDDLVATYLHHLRETVQADPGVVCPGVRWLLDTLAVQRDMRLALGTGNLESGARIKLAAHGLNIFFPTGGFGSDAAERAEVIAAGIAKAEAWFGERFAKVVVVGDTPLDVACARANGVHSIAVATGAFGLEELRQAGATLVLPDLTGTKAFVDAVGALAPTGQVEEEVG
ncbi:MAG: HAD family hydrolase [Bacteroidota bacterium]